MKARVTDTNVPVVANGRAEQAKPACRLACVAALNRIVQQERIVLDTQGRILCEYASNLSHSGQPGVGDAFFKWVFQNQANEDRCERVELHSREGPKEDYEEFPNDSRLHSFDPSDRKFVAVALASKHKPTVLNAVDSDWWNHRTELEEHAVRIEFLCPEQFSNGR